MEMQKGSVRHAERATNHDGSEFAGEEMTFVKRDNSAAGLETRFVGGAGDALDGAGNLWRGCGLVGKEGGFLDDSEAQAVARPIIAHRRKIGVEATQTGGGDYGGTAGKFVECCARSENDLEVLAGPGDVDRQGNDLPLGFALILTRPTPRCRWASP